jgi:nucleoside-diphosphate-sugar epimerase
MRVSITGGTGCLGLPLINKFISIGANLKFLSLPDEADKTRLKQYGEIILGDINSESSLDLLTKNCDVVFHLAAKVHTIPRTKDEEQDFYKVNVEGTKKLLEAAKRNEVKRLIYYSTVGVYGKEFNFYGDELSPCNPNTVYSKSKYQAEKLVLESSKNGGPEGVVLRFPVVYGPEDRGNVARMIKAIRRNLFFYIGDGSAKRSIISSKNTAEAAFLSAFETDASNQIFCVTDGCDYSMEQLVDAICLILNKKMETFSYTKFYSKLDRESWGSI